MEIFVGMMIYVFFVGVLIYALDHRTKHWRKYEERQVQKEEKTLRKWAWERNRQIELSEHTQTMWLG
jgi:hypothetical protein